mmetsp:Transcript_28167/g.66906  ORF Transcript_28167/g.66906 Transcript_28167/m.66906 type:complete len:114 (-) Transcript_28167:465-806(-)
MRHRGHRENPPHSALAALPRTADSSPQWNWLPRGVQPEEAGIGRSIAAAGQRVARSTVGLSLERGRSMAAEKLSVATGGGAQGVQEGQEKGVGHREREREREALREERGGGGA